MGFALLCFVICGFMMWGMLAKFGESIHDELVEPLCIKYAEDGTRSIPKFIVVGLIFNSFYKALSRSPLWITLYYIITYLNYSDARAIGFVALCIAAQGLKRTASDITRHFPKPANYKDNYGHKYDNAWND